MPTAGTIRGIAIETSGREGSVAAMLDGRVVHSERFSHGLQHAAGLVAMVGRVIEGAGWTEPEVDEVYLSIGPGSFTGLRIGVTLVKSWALARQLEGVRAINIVAVPTVRVLVENLPDSAAHAAIALDAKRGQIFTASFSRDAGGQWQETRPARLDTLANVIAIDPKPLALVGEGLPYHPHPEVDGVWRAGPELAAARAEALGEIGYAIARTSGETSGENPTVFANPLTLIPTYIRLPEAEEKWQLAQAEKSLAEKAGV